MASSTTSGNRATIRTVILLRRSDKLKLERIAAKENLSSAEVIRRFIQNGDEIFQLKRDEQMIEAALKMISKAAVEANESLCRSIDKIDRLHADLSKRATA